MNVGEIEAIITLATPTWMVLASQSEGRYPAIFYESLRGFDLYHSSRLELPDTACAGESDNPTE